MTQNKPDSFTFSELLCAKFCHDLAGPVGALNNGIEFLADDSSPEMQQQAYDLLSLSASEAFARLRLFRIAYGVVNYSGESSISELKSIVDDFFKHGNINFTWNDFDKVQTGSISNYIRQVIGNMVTITASIMAYGGNLTVHLENADNGQKSIRVVGEHERMRDDPELSNIFAGKGNMNEATTRNVQCYFLYELAKKLNISLSLDEKATKVELVAKYSK